MTDGFFCYFLFTLMLLNFIPQRYVAAREAVSWISLVSWRHFLQSGLVHWTWKQHITMNITVYVNLE